MEDLQTPRIAYLPLIQKVNPQSPRHLQLKKTLVYLTCHQHPWVYKLKKTFRHGRRTTDPSQALVTQTLRLQKETLTVLRGQEVGKCP